jgi:hypothetical protein
MHPGASETVPVCPARETAARAVMSAFGSQLMEAAEASRGDAATESSVTAIAAPAATIPRAGEADGTVRMGAAPPTHAAFRSEFGDPCG